MSLSCECSNEYEFMYHHPDDYSISDNHTKCCSCNKTIIAGSLLTCFECFETDDDGDEIIMPDLFMCEKCSDIFYSLYELGFCISLGENMLDLLDEYHNEYGN